MRTQSKGVVEVEDDDEIGAALSLQSHSFLLVAPLIVPLHPITQPGLACTDLSDAQRLDFDQELTTLRVAIREISDLQMTLFQNGFDVRRDVNEVWLIEEKEVRVAAEERRVEQLLDQVREPPHSTLPSPLMLDPSPTPNTHSCHRPQLQ